MNDLPDKELLRVTEVAEYLRMAKSTVYSKIESGDLEAEKLGGCVRVLRKSVLDFRLLSKINPFE